MLVRTVERALPAIQARYAEADARLPAVPKATLEQVGEFYELVQRMAAKLEELGPAGQRVLADLVIRPNGSAERWPGWPAAPDGPADGRSTALLDHVARFAAPFAGGFEPRQNAPWRPGVAQVFGHVTAEEFKRRMDLNVLQLIAGCYRTITGRGPAITRNGDFYEFAGGVLELIEPDNLDAQGRNRRSRGLFGKLRAALNEDLPPVPVLGITLKIPAADGQSQGRK